MLTSKIMRNSKQHESSGELPVPEVERRINGCITESQNGVQSAEFEAINRRLNELSRANEALADEVRKLCDHAQTSAKPGIGIASASGSFVAGLGLGAVLVPVLIVALYYGINGLIWLTETYSLPLVPVICGAVCVAAGVLMLCFSGRIGRFLERQVQLITESE